MKGKFLLPLILIVALVIGAVGCAQQTGKVEASGSSGQQELHKSPAGGDQSVSAPKGGTPGQSAGTNGNSVTNENPTTNEISVIAKSGSQTPSDEKEAILDEISRELDEILDITNNLEEVPESDLE